MPHPHPSIRRRTPVVEVKHDPKRGGIDNSANIPSKAKGRGMKLPITVIITSYKTPHLLKQCTRTLFKYYPGIRTIISDNNSGDGSVQYIRGLAENDDVRAVFHRRNIGHGPAMHYVIQKGYVTTPFFFTLDTDTVVVKGEFLEAMLAHMNDNPKLYAIGWQRWVDKITGVPVSWHREPPANRSKFIKYIHPHAGLYRLSLYKTLRPFHHHGAPCLHNMVDAWRHGYPVMAFPIKDYVKHLIAGTRRMWDGNWDVKDKPPKHDWRPDRTYPI